MSDSEPPSSNSLKSASSVKDVNAYRAPFGSRHVPAHISTSGPSDGKFKDRFLKNEADVWNYNSWDHVPPPDDQDDIVSAALAKQHSSPVAPEDKVKYNTKPSRNWDNFYKANRNNFFRDRNWLRIEFPELIACTEPEAGHITVAEIGCGAGNTVYPILSVNQNPHLFLRAFDYSSHAVKLVQNNPVYNSTPCGSIKASVWDVSAATLPEDLEPGTVDVAVLIFVLSALHPDEWRQAVFNIHKMLKPGGLLLLRDYGRHDLAQLRFKSKRLLEDNFYIRGDKTRVYFFDLDELALMFTGTLAPADKVINHQKQAIDSEEPDGDEEAETDYGGNEHASLAPSPEPSEDQGSALNSASNGKETKAATATSIHPNLRSSGFTDLPQPMFSVDQLGADRRLLVNRKKQLKMYRVWMQGKFRKLAETPSGGG